MTSWGQHGHNLGTCTVTLTLSQVPQMIPGSSAGATHSTRMLLPQTDQSLCVQEQGTGEKKPFQGLPWELTLQTARASAVCTAHSQHTSWSGQTSIHPLLQILASMQAAPSSALQA